ncbi:hypothetical protein ACSN53_003143 [Escherichia coli]
MRFLSLFLLAVVSSSSAELRELQTGNDLLYNIQQGKRVMIFHRFTLLDICAE